MTARPISFSAPMIRALLDGRKTQTRRIVTPDGKYRLATMAPADGGPPRCPYGQHGDLLWVRETWQFADWTEDGLPFIRYQASDDVLLRERFPESWGDRLSDTWAELSKDENYRIDSRAADRRWRPSIHMPRWASRLTLRLIDVRVQRVQEISDADAQAEGVPFTELPQGRDAPDPLHRAQFADIWESIHGPEAWDENPWVWALTFETIRENVDRVEKQEQKPC